MSWDEIIAVASSAGFLKFNHSGIAVLALPVLDRVTEPPQLEGQPA